MLNYPTESLKLFKLGPSLENLLLMSLHTKEGTAFGTANTSNAQSIELLPQPTLVTISKGSMG